MVEVHPLSQLLGDLVPHVGQEGGGRLAAKAGMHLREVEGLGVCVGLVVVVVVGEGDIARGGLKAPLAFGKQRR